MLPPGWKTSGMLDKCLDFRLNVTYKTHSACNYGPPKTDQLSIFKLTACKICVVERAFVGTTLTQSNATWSRTTCLQLVQI